MGIGTLTGIVAVTLWGKEKVVVGRLIALLLWAN
jgi:hypothetical protein